MAIKRIKINVGGTIFTTLESTLERIQESKLAQLDALFEDNYDDENKEYYFDRDPVLFNSILNLHRTGSLHLPKDVCGIQAKNELEFWGIPPTMISNCCWKTFYQSNEDIKILKYLAEEFSHPDMDSMSNCNEKSLRSTLSRLRHGIWVFLMNPYSSFLAKVWYVIYMIIILLSIVTYFIDTFEYAREVEDWVPTTNRTTVSKFWRIFAEQPKPGIHAINTFCNVIFTVEYVLRIACCSNKIKFLKCYLNAADFLSIIGFLIISITPRDCIKYIYKHCADDHGHFCMSRVGSVDDDWIGDGTIYLLLAGHILLSFRNFRFYRLGRMVQMLKLLILSVQQSARELGLLLLIILMNAIVFAGLIFYAELLKGRHFKDYYEAFYWSIITMTTVGYGDVFPDDAIGRIVAIFCSITGLFLLTMPIAVISNNFNELYSRHKDRQRHEKNLKLYYDKTPKESINNGISYINCS